jgi:hypothetical protein
MYCPQCGKRFWFRTSFCPDCRVGLVQHPPRVASPDAPTAEDPEAEELSARDGPAGELTDGSAEDVTQESTEAVTDDVSEGDRPAHTGPHSDPQLTRVFTASDPALIALAQSLLEENGVEYLTQSGVLRGIGVNAGPEQFWVRGDEAQHATDILRDLIEQSPPPEPSGEDER